MNFTHSYIRPDKDSEECSKPVKDFPPFHPWILSDRIESCVCHNPCRYYFYYFRIVDGPRAYCAADTLDLVYSGSGSAYPCYRSRLAIPWAILWLCPPDIPSTNRTHSQIHFLLDRSILVEGCPSINPPPEYIRIMDYMLFRRPTRNRRIKKN